jgi:hypothetical protein
MLSWKYSKRYPSCPLGQAGKVGLLLLLIVGFIDTTVAHLITSSPILLQWKKVKVCRMKMALVASPMPSY